MFLKLQVEATSMSVSFTGSPCIPAYSFNLCPPNPEECTTQESDEPATTFSNLEPCSWYTLEVTPLMGEERRRWSTAVHHEFVTKEELRAPPQESLMVGEWNSLTGQLPVSWEKTSCADAFEIRLLGEEGEERTEPYRTGSSDENFLMLGNGGEVEVRGCTNYFLEVSTISKVSRFTKKAKAITRSAKVILHLSGWREEFWFCIFSSHSWTNQRLPL